MLHFEKGSFSDYIILGAVAALIAFGIFLALWKVGCVQHASRLCQRSSSSMTRRKQNYDHETACLMSDGEGPGEEMSEIEERRGEVELSVARRESGGNDGQ
jgi:hypothetical protein